MSRFSQTVRFDAAPARLFAAIGTSADHAAFTGEAAAIGGAGEAWSAYGGKIGGITLDVDPGKRIVQAWRAGNWAPGTYSLVTFEFAADGDGGTITMTHDAVPDDGGEHLEQGWHNMYWTPLAAWLAA